MIDKKKLKIKLFQHIDGIALTAPISTLFIKHEKIFDFLKKTQTTELNFEELILNGINADYLNVTLRLFESQRLATQKNL